MPLAKYIEIFINPKLKIHQHDRFKANALIWLHLIMVVFGGVSKVVEIILEVHNDVDLTFMIILATLLLFLFKYLGNFTLSGNLIAALIALILFPSVVVSGGLLSDNFLWCILIPLVALLFGDFRSGLLWLFILILFAVWLLQTGTYVSDHPFFKKYTPLYFFISYCSFFLTIFFVVNIFRSEQSNLVASLSEKNQLLEQHKIAISQKSQDLEAAKNQLESSNRELEQFAYVASHDLKEPLRMISMYTQMIQRRLKGQLEGDTLEFMGYVVDGVKRMQQMLEDLLNYSRLGKNLDLAKVDLNDTMFLVQQNLKLTLREKNGVITFETLPTIYAVSSEVTQLFQNLIGNSLKFCDKTRQPEIKIGVQMIDTDSFVLYIKDNGIGIPESSKERIFNLFERLHNRDEYQGTGIGLATCRKVMDNLGGEIWVESVENEGSTFFVKFPNSVLENPER